jgi:hypothetical protein
VVNNEVSDEQEEKRFLIGAAVVPLLKCEKNRKAFFNLA